MEVGFGSNDHQKFKNMEADAITLNVKGLVYLLW